MTSARITEPIAELGGWRGELLATIRALTPRTTPKTKSAGQRISNGNPILASSLVGGGSGI